MDPTVSVSKGCFLFKKKSSPRKRVESPTKRSRSVAETESLSFNLRVNAYKKLWASVEEELSDMKKEVYAGLFEDVIHYVQNSWCVKAETISCRENAKKSSRSKKDDPDIPEELAVNFTSLSFKDLEKEVSGSRTSGNITSGPVSMYRDSQAPIPVAVLQIGMNISDHSALYNYIITQLKEEVSPYIAVLRSKDCGTIQAMMGKIVMQFMSTKLDENEVISEDVKLKRHQWNMEVLQSWYCSVVSQEVGSPVGVGFKRSSRHLRNSIDASSKTTPSKKSRRGESSPSKYKKSPRKAMMKSPKYRGDLPEKENLAFNGEISTPAIKNSVLCKKKIDHSGKPHLVIVLEDFEAFSDSVLHRFIEVLSTCVEKLPVVLIFGVATCSSVVHRSLPYHISSLIEVAVFDVQPSMILFSNVIEKVVISESTPFHLGARVLKFLVEMFLFCDLSVHQLIQGLKYCMLEYFYSNPVSILCCESKEVPDVVDGLNHEVLEKIRQLGSFRKYVEGLPPKERAPLILDDKITEEKIKTLMKHLHSYVFNFNTMLRCLFKLSENLPESPLGKKMYELYIMSLSSSIVETDEFKKCFQFLKFQSREEFVLRIGKILDILNGAKKKSSRIREVAEDLQEKFESLKTSEHKIEEPVTRSSPKKLQKINRYEVKERLMEISQMKASSVRERIQQEILDYLCAVFTDLLESPACVPLHEILFFNQLNSVKDQLAGAPRISIQMSLSKPHHYLKCDCCRISDTGSILSSMPDICILYKLHLECGRLINLYDWLQAFLAVVNPSNAEEQREVDPELQARFTRAVAELQFLGFIAPSKKKSDHVMRMTWGSC